MSNKYFELIEIELDKLNKFQKGNLKVITKQQKMNLRKMLLHEGLKSPFFVWKNKNKYYIIDGHQRYDALIELKKENKIKIDKVPAVEIKAKNKTEAMEILLLFNTHYSKINKNELLTVMEEFNITNDFIKDINIELSVIYSDIDNLTKIDNKNLQTTNYLIIEYNENNIKAIKNILEILNKNNIYYEQVK